MADAKSVPIKLLHEAEALKVQVELKNGEIYRGTLLSSEDNMNCHLSKVTMTQRDGQVNFILMCSHELYNEGSIVLKNCNCLLFWINRIQTKKLEQVFLRGSMIRLYILPDILKDAPLFGQVQKMVDAAAENPTPAGGKKAKSK